MEEFILENLEKRYNDKIRFKVDSVQFREYNIKLQIENNIEKCFVFKWDYNMIEYINLCDIFHYVDNFIIGYFLRSDI